MKVHKMKFSIKDFFSKCDQIRSFLGFLNGKFYFLCSGSVNLNWQILFHTPCAYQVYYRDKTEGKSLCERLASKFRLIAIIEMPCIFLVEFAIIHDIFLKWRLYIRLTENGYSTSWLNRWMSVCNQDLNCDPDIGQSTGEVCLDNDVPEETKSI